MAAPARSGIARRAARRSPAARGSTAPTEPGSPCPRAPAALLAYKTQRKGTQSRREQRSFSPSSPCSDIARQEKAPALCQACRLSFIPTLRAARLQHALGFTGAVAPLGGRGCLLLSGRCSLRCHAERAQCGEGAHLPWVTGDCPAGSARAQWLQTGVGVGYGNVVTM